MTNGDNKSLRKRILWPIVIPAAAIVITVFVGVAVAGFEWSLVVELFKRQWVLFLVIFGVVFGLLFLMARDARKVIFIGLLTIAFLFILASLEGGVVSDSIRQFIDGLFDIRYLVGSISVMALALAIFRINKNELD